ncbi:MAG: hypothetical protein AABW75_00135 [Nanoarchaeota archaeon]
MDVILDSSFIISCIKRKIDFSDELEKMGFKIVLSKEVFQELKDLRLKVPHNERMAIDVAFDILENKKIKKIRLGEKIVDKGLIKKGKEGHYIATLDSVIKREVPNKILISDSKNSLIIERD